MCSHRLISAALGLAITAPALAGLLGATAEALPPVLTMTTQARAAYDRAQQSDRREEARDAARLLASADGQMTSGNLILAIEAYEGVIARFPNSPEAVAARRRILEARGLIKSPARKDASATVTAKPEPAPALVAIAPPAATLPKTLSPAALAQRQNEEFKAAAADRIFFSRNSAELSPADIHVLRLQAQWLLRRKEILLWLEARADDGDAAEIDAALALERGAAVKSLLVKEGIEAKRIRVAVIGRDRPIAFCDKLVARARQLLDPAAIDAAEACAAHNRSVVTVVGPEGFAYEPSIAEGLKSIESDGRRKTLSEQQSPLRQ